MDNFEHEQEAIEEAHASGEIKMKEYIKQMRELQRDYQGAAEEAAEEAYRNEMARW